MIATIKKLPILILPAILALLVIACGSGEPDTYRIGVMESLTGAGETYGTVALQSKQMALDEINCRRRNQRAHAGARRRGL